MKDNENYLKSVRTMDFKEIQNVWGGRIWPIIDLLSYLQNIIITEDLTLGDLFPQKTK